ncbi:unnamed protein product [Jaminaea pallidilutea]
MSAAATLPRPTPTTRWQASLHHATIPRSLHSSAIVRAPAPPTPASSTETPDIVPLSQQEYSQLTDRVFDSLVGQLETMLDEMDDQSWEVEYSQGVMTLKAPPTGTYVINKQPPNKQIWLSSPISGPKRFDYTSPSKVWTCVKEGQTTRLHELLNEELSQAFQQDVRVLEDLE